MHAQKIVRAGKPVVAFVVAAMMVVSGFFVPNVKAAETWNVTPLSTGLCDNTDRNCSTIQAAVNAAAAGDTIIVAAGTYNENVSVNKSLTLQGAQAGVDARSRSGLESVVNGGLVSAPFQITANDVTLDGFTITGGGDGGGVGLGTGVHIGIGVSSGYSLLNNIVTGNIIGVYANCAGSCLIQQNSFDANNVPGAAGGAGIYLEESNGLTINENEFVNHALNNPVIFAAVGPAKHMNVAFTNNDINDEFGIYLISIDGGVFSGNTFNTNEATGISLAGANENIDVTNNTFGSTGARGVRVRDDGYGFGNNSDIEIHNNFFSGNSDYAVGNVSGYVGSLNAEKNWWGDPSGPQSLTYPGGTGDVASGDVDFIPWCTDTACTSFEGPVNLTTVASPIGSEAELTTGNNALGTPLKYGVDAQFNGPAVEDRLQWQVKIIGPTGLEASQVQLTEVAYDDEDPLGVAVTSSSENYTFMQVSPDTIMATGSCVGGPCTPGSFGLAENDHFQNYDRITFANNAPAGPYRMERVLVDTQNMATTVDDTPFSDTLTTNFNMATIVPGGGGGGGGGPTPTPTPSPTGSPTPTPSPGTTPTPSPTPQVAGAADVNIAALGLSEGNVISGGIDAYIVNQFGYKRLLLNPIIFSFYGHLGGFLNVKNVVSNVLSALTTSNLYRNCEANTPQVYALEVTGEDAGILHWVNMTAEQVLAGDPNFFKKVFCINNNEFNWYPKGVEYTSLSQIQIYVGK